MVEPRGQSFSILADVRVRDEAAQGVLFKQGAGHGGHVLFVADGRLHYVYNFMGEDQQSVVAPEALPTGSHVLGVRYDRTGTVEGSHTPLGTVSLYVDDTVVATRDGVRTHPATFGLAGGAVEVGRNGGQPVCSDYTAPFEFTGGTIVKVVVDVSGTPYVDRERELAAAFARD
jgi:arylsulfatase